MQNEFIVHNSHLRIGFCEIWHKYVVITVKNHEKYGEKKIIFFDKNKKLTTNYWHLLKGELILYICCKNCIQDVNILSTPVP